jgi:hypothetical protein
MSRALVVLNSLEARLRAADWCKRAPFGTRVAFKATKRSVPQNDRMYAMLGEVAAQMKHHGIPLKVDEWKLLFIDALKREMRVIPNLDGTGLVALGRSSSDLSKEEMAELLSLIEAWGVTHGVKFNDPAGIAA